MVGSISEEAKSVLRDFKIIEAQQKVPKIGPNPLTFGIKSL